MDARPINGEATGSKPTPVELATVAAILMTGRRPNDIESVLDDAMRLLEAAEHRLARKPLSDVQQIQQAAAERLAKQPRYCFAPHLPTDPAREYLEKPDASRGWGAMRNVSKGSTVEAKLREFRSDQAMVWQTSEEGAKKLEQAQFEISGWDDDKPVYAVLKSELDAFRGWHLEIARIEALNRKGIAQSPLDIWVRLRSISTTSKLVFIDVQTQKRLILEEMDLATAEQVSSKIISKLRSLRLKNPRGERRPKA